MSAVKIAYHASHEQFKPSDLLRYAITAEKAGFQAVHSSDHFHPWSENQGECGYSFSWLGAAMQATELPFGLVCAPGQRYHPAVVAQAAATLAEMFPDRFWLALGSGEAINERITGQGWPAKAIRNERLWECFHVIQKLLQGEQVNYNGHIKVENAKLYTLPRAIPPLIGAAITKETARWMGGWAEGLLTVSQPIDQLKEVIQAFHEGGGKGKPLYLKVQLSYARDGIFALSSAYQQWKSNVLNPALLADLPSIHHLEAAASFVKPEDIKQSLLIYPDAKYYVEVLQEYQELGFDCLILHNVNTDQESFIRDFGEEVLPYL